MIDFTISSNGGGALHCGMWKPSAPPKAILQVVHGIAEHIGRYEEFGQFLAEHGVLMVADDHMGHGKSVAEGESFGVFQGGWEAAVDDEESLRRHMAAQYPAVPYFIMGHSMGSFLTRTLLYRHGGRGIAGAILSGTGWLSSSVIHTGLRLCSREEKKLTETGVSDMLQKLVFGGYNRKFSPTRTEHDWICNEETVVDAYCNDPLCGFQPTIGLITQMLRGMEQNQDPKNLAAMRKTMPIYFFAGDQDPVGDMGKGVKKAAKAFEKAGMVDVMCKLYPGGRHEMLNESCKNEVFLDIYRWICEKLGDRVRT